MLYTLYRTLLKFIIKVVSNIQSKKCKGSREKSDIFKTTFSYRTRQYIYCVDKKKNKTEDKAENDNLSYFLPIIVICILTK